MRIRTLWFTFFLMLLLLLPPLFAQISPGDGADAPSAADSAPTAGAVADADGSINGPAATH